MNVEKNLGVVTAYGSAIQGGYNGTAEEFYEELANLPQYASRAETAAETSEEDVQTVLDAKDAAETAAQNASDSASTASTAAQNASAAQQAAEDAQAAAEDAAASITTDDTLSITGKAADAKKTGDEIAELKNDLDDISGPGVNLFDKDNVNYLDAHILGNQHEDGTITSNANAKTVYIPCEPNTTYTVSKTTATTRFAVAYTTLTPTIGGTAKYVCSDATAKSITITTGASAAYLIAFIYLSTSDTETFAQICDMLQIQIGDTATAYQPYELTAIDKPTRATVEGISEIIPKISGPGTNLFDKDHISYVEAYIFGNVGGNGQLSGNTNARTVYIQCDPNTTYTVSKQQASARFTLGYTKETPAVGGTVYNVRPYSSNTAITITTGDDAAYLVAFVYLSTADTMSFEQICAMLQIQIGSMATAYRAYSITAFDQEARDNLSGLMQSDALQGIFGSVSASDVTIAGTPQAARYGSALSLDFAGMSHSGNVSWADNAWVVDHGGTISASISGVTAGKTYLISVGVDISTVVSTGGDIETNPATIAFSDQSLSIFSAADANWYIALTPTVGGTVTLSIAFDSAWSGTVRSLSVKQVLENHAELGKINGIDYYLHFADIAIGGGQKGVLRIEGSPGAGNLNTALGNNAQRDINTGMWNTAFGYNAQLQLTQGKGNNAFGCFTQNALETGCYNNAFGESAQNHMTSGQWNDGFGIETQGMATSAKNNVAFGRRSQHLLQTGNFNTAVGAWSGFNSHDVSPEGKNAVKTSSFTTLIGGGSTLKSPDTGDSDYATAVGFQTKVDKQGVAIGALAEADEGGIAIGYNAKAGAGEVVIGNKKIIFNLDGSVSWETVT